MIIVVDTREQQPYTFAGLIESGGSSAAPIVYAALPSGDYSLQGYETHISIERKSLPDFLQSLGRSRRRFEQEIVRLNDYHFAVVIVEAEWSQVLSEGPAHSQMNLRSVRGTVVAWMQRYPRVHWEFLPGRRAAELATFRHLQRFWNDRAKEHRHESGMESSL